MKDKQLILDTLKSFLISKGWLLNKETERWLHYLAPAELCFSEPYVLNIPNSIKFIDFIDSTNRIIHFLSEVYEIPENDIRNYMSDDSIMSVRLIDDVTKEGTIPLTRFKEAFEELPNLIENVGNFIINKTLYNTEKDPKIAEFLSQCQFMQTEKGSFVLKIQMPSGYVIKEANLFDMNFIKSDAISEKLQAIFDFVTDKVFADSQEIKQEDFVIQNFQLLSINALDSLSSMLSKSRMEEIDFTFYKKGRSKTIKLTGIKTYNLKKLKDYIKFLEGIEPEETVVVDYSGRIIEMKSKNPQGDNNSVTIQTDVQNEEKPKRITVCLNNEDYQMAIDAHKDNLSVHITGIAKQLKNSLKIQDLTGFSLHTENR